MIRIESKHLFSENTSPWVKSIILKKRAGITLNEQEENRLKVFNESVSMVEIPKNRKQNVPSKHIQQPEEDELEDTIDLDELLREMGYGDDEDTEDITKLDRESLVSLIKQEVNSYFEETMKEPDDIDINEIIENLLKWDLKESEDEVGLGDELELEELMMELDEDDDELGENITYDISYISKSNGQKKYHTIRRDFKNKNHFSNWYKWMNNQGLKILGTHDVK